MDRLYRSEIPAIVDALHKQRLADEYRDMHDRWAFLASTITNGFSGLAASMSTRRRKPKMLKPEDFIDKGFQRLFDEVFKEARPAKKMDWASLVEDAKAKGLRGPWKATSVNS